MTVYNWPEDFEWPYAGQPRTVPPDFKKRMVRVQDQIFWLLNALHKLNAGAISEERADQIGLDHEKAANAYTVARVREVNAALEALEEEVRALNLNIAVSRNPATGANDFIYKALVQLYDIARPHAITWDELDAEGITWAQLDGDYGMSWYELDVRANDMIRGHAEERILVTPADHIEVGSPGYVPSLYQTGTTYDELDSYGFLYSRNA